MNQSLFFVFDPDGGQMADDLPALFAHLAPQPKPVSPARDKKPGKKLGSGRSFRTIGAQLAARDLHIAGVYKRHDGKIVFLVGDKPDTEAVGLFYDLTISTGWSVLKYKNEDGSVVFAAKAPQFLSDKVNQRSGADSVTKVARDWSRHLIIL